MKVHSISRWLLEKTHISYHILFVSLGVILGAAVSPFVKPSFLNSSWIIVVVALLLIVVISKKRTLLLVAMIAGAIFGLWRGDLTLAALDQYQSYVGNRVVVIGRVDDDASFGPKGDQRLWLDKIIINQQPLTGRVWVSLAEKSDIKRGDTVTVSGIMLKGFGNTPASLVRAETKIITRPVPGDIGRRARDWFGESIHKIMSESDANFAMAFLLGQKLSLPGNLSDQLRTVGLIHAVVASGYQLTILVSIMRRLLVKVSKYLTAALSFVLIGGFILITGFSPSMTRAGIVAGLGLIAWYYGRRFHPLLLIIFAASLTVIYQPQYVWGDIGWLLSFAAFTGVLIFAPLLHHYFWGLKPPSFIREVLVGTLAAQLLTLPITIYAFQYYSIYALLANLLVVPIIPFIMLLTFIAGIFAIVLLPIGIVFGYTTSVLLGYVSHVVDWIYHLPHSKTELKITIVAVVLSYLLILLTTLYLWKATKHDFKNFQSKLNLF